MSQTVAKCYKISQNVSKMSQIFKYGSKMSQNASRMSQNVTEHFKKRRLEEPSKAAYNSQIRQKEQLTIRSRSRASIFLRPSPKTRTCSSCRFQKRRLFLYWSIKRQNALRSQILELFLRTSALLSWRLLSSLKIKLRDVAEYFH